MDPPSKQIIFGYGIEPSEDYNVFCDGRVMKLSEMRALVAEDMRRFAELDAKKRKLEKDRFAVLEEQHKARKKAEFAQHFRWKFEQWERANQRGAELEEEAAQRAAQREVADRNAMMTLMVRIAQKELRGSRVYNNCLDHLSDEDFIELKFAMAAKPSRRWLAPL